MKPEDLGRMRLGDDALDPEATNRLWTGIGSRRRSLVVRRRAARAGAVLAGAALAAVLLAGRAGPLRSFLPPPATAASAGPLRRLGGAPLEMLTATAHEESVPLEDASVIALGRGARLEPRTNTAASFVSRLVGDATFTVTPGGVRRWSIECGPATVDVIGTQFHIEEKETDGDHWVRVSVEHGVVLVRGETVPDHVQRLVDGQTIDVHSQRVANAAGSAVLEPSPTDTPPPPVPTAGLRKAPGATQAGAGPSSWRALASRGDYAEAYREVGPAKIEEESAHASVDDLLALGDVARLSGHPREAVAPLTRVMNEHGSDARAGVAAFTLGRIQLDTLGQPDVAAAAFARSIELGLPAGLSEDAYARLVEAYAKAGNHAAARTAAAQYAGKFPQGSRSSTINRWIAGD